MRRRGFVGPYRTRVAAVDIEDAQLVDAMGVVGMLMGAEHGIERVDAARQHLLAQIRRGIDQDARCARPCPAALEQQRAAQAPVARLLGIAGAPLIADARHAARRSAAQDGQRRLTTILIGRPAGFDLREQA